MAPDILTRVTTLNAMVSLLPASSPSSSRQTLCYERKVPSVKCVPTVLDAHNLLHATPDACRGARHASLFLVVFLLFSLSLSLSLSLFLSLFLSLSLHVASKLCKSFNFKARKFHPLENLFAL